ncbi:MAG: alpha/beta hydrolase [Bifidobacteriaceae bacterium]|jgi:pimeloyl-ACP methyl ester carboxylesterase|nr:alpha/beta hydrolase [Bifidobacteriaceae bacterium]MCI1979542.1 alpha/beta hydrolase [Bifidobacteriaceae bacterium]
MEIGVTKYRSGTGRIPVVFIHGFPVDHRMWNAAAEQVSTMTTEDGLASVPLYSFEMPGAGTTAVPSAADTGEVAADGAYTQALDLMAAAFVKALRSRGYEKAIWIGLSMGGYAVLSIQRQFPDSVAGIGLCDTKPDADTPASRAHRLRIAEEALNGAGSETVMHFAQPEPGDSEIKKSAGFIRLFTRWIREQTPQGIAWRQRMAAGRPEQTEVLAQITAPTLLLSGERDPSSPPAKMRPYCESVPSAFFVEVPDAGHFTAVERPQAVAEAIVRLMRKVSR